MSDELRDDLGPVVDFFGLPDKAPVAKDFHVVGAVRALMYKIDQHGRSLCTPVHGSAFFLSYAVSMKKGTTVQDRLEQRIARKRGDVFLRADFNDLGGYVQVGRPLRQLVEKGQLMKIGQGLYARAEKSPFSGKPVPPKGLGTLREALRRLGVEPLPTRLEQATRPVRLSRCRRAAWWLSAGGFAARSVTMVFTSSLNVLDRTLVEAVARRLSAPPGLIEQDRHVARSVAVLAG